MILHFVFLLSIISFFVLSMILLKRITWRTFQYFKTRSTKEKSSDKNSLDELVIKQKHSNIDIPEAILERISGIVGRKLQYACRFMLRDSFVFCWTDNIVKNQKTIDCKHINFHFRYCSFYDFNMPFFKVFIEKHYGEPRWDGKEMHYNYPIEQRSYNVSLHAFEDFWKRIEKETLNISMERQPFSVKNGNTTYFNYKQYNHIFETV